MQIRTVQVGPLQTNCYLAICPESRAAAIIDPGWSGESLFHILQEEGADLKAILLTHVHFDHVAGLAALKRLTGAPIMAHPECARSLAYAHEHALSWGFQIDPAPPIDTELKEGQIIRVGTLGLQVIYTPGHAPGHVSFYEPVAKALFDGDVLFQSSIGRYDLPGGDLTVLLHSIQEKLLALPGETMVYPGHGPATTIAAEKRWNPFLR